MAYNPGVMDPVEESVLKGIRDLGIDAVTAVRTASKYLLWGDIPDETLSYISDKLLVNSVVQHVVTDEEVSSRSASWARSACSAAPGGGSAGPPARPPPRDAPGPARGAPSRRARRRARCRVRRRPSPGRGGRGGGRRRATGCVPPARRTAATPPTGAPAPQAGFPQHLVPLADPPKMPRRHPADVRGLLPRELALHRLPQDLFVSR